MYIHLHITLVIPDPIIKPIIKLSFIRILLF
nr:MAG TPA: hypothetical protein [Caudoviricetes sp.]